MSASYRPPLSSRASSRPPVPPGLRVRSRSSTSRPRAVTIDGKPVTASPPPGCICTREYGTVFCQSCGWICQNRRVRIPCPVHIMTIYLMDIDMCPKCRAFAPVLTEFPRK